ncbi:MAG TPA: B-box zinc finger protein [Bryobacteraceae bacterium]|nr:B-box zinc finger protein [Bryobacteraceae bacterium]
MPIACARCNAPLPVWELAAAGHAGCTSCGSRNTVSAFPALFAPTQAPARAEVALDGEAACFDHPGKRAVAACQQCGRFVCQLCAVEFGGIWCPTCVAAGAGPAKAANLDTERTLYDSIALLVPVATLLVFWPITTITGPGALVFALARWKRPLSLVRRTRWRFIAAILIGFGETIGWIWVVVYYLTRFMARQ